MQTTPLLFLSPYPCADPLQIFEGNAATGAFSNGNYVFGNLVVNVGSEPALFAPALTQKAFGAPGTFGLQVTAQPSVSRPSAVDLSACIAFAVASLGDGNHAEINAYKIRDWSNFGRWLVNRNEQEPFAVAIDQIGFATLEIKKRSVTFAAHERDSLPSVQAPDTYCVRSKIPGQDARVVGNRALSAEGASCFVVELVSIGNLRHEPHHDLSGKRKFIADSSVAKPVDRVLAKLFRVWNRPEARP